MKKSLLFSLILLFVSTFTVYGQSTISGKVTDAGDGTPIPGVNVVVKGTTTGGTTDIDGKYQVKVPAGAKVLVFSYVGYEDQEVEIGNQTTINVSLKADVTALEEVVVTAIGLEANKRDLGYSVQNVNADEVAKSMETNMVSALSGKVAGVQIISSGGSPGASAQVRIRGNTTIGGNNSPLFVVDGIPIDNSNFTTADAPEDARSNLGSGGVTNSNRAIDINPDDIESITVLKGPAATALYGLRAGNGAVIIQTKRGKKGEKAKIRFSTSFTADRVNKLPELQDLYAQGTAEVDANNNWVPTFSGPMTGAFTGTSWGPLLSDLRYANEASMWDRNGLIVPAGDARATNRVVNAYDNLGDFFQTGTTLNNNLSFSGGTAKTSYYIGIGNTQQTGIIPNSEFERTSIRATINTDLSEKLSAMVTANYINSGGNRVQQGSNTSGVMLGLLRTSPSFDNSNGFGSDGADNPAAYSFPDQGGLPRAYRGILGTRAIYDNPFWTVNKNTMEDNVNRIIGNASLSYKITPWLKASYKIGIDQYSDSRKFKNDIGSGSFAAGQVVNHQINSRDLNSDFILQMTKDFGDDISVSALIGHNYYRKDIENNRTEGQGLASRGFFNLASASTIIATELPQQKQLYGVYTDWRVSYKDQFFLGFTGRQDYTSTLSEENNSFFYYSVSGGWAFTETLGLSANDILPYGKIRISYGKVGNDAPIYATYSGFGQSRVRDGWTTPNGVLFPSLGTNAFQSNQILGNPNLEPEFTSTFEIGADLRMFKGRVTADITYYNAVTENLILSTTLPFSTGYQQTAQNAGRISNKGIEAVISATPIKTSNLTWDVGINFSTFENIVEEMAPGLPFIRIDPFGTQRIAEGETYGIFFGSRFLRDGNGNMVIDPGTGLPLEDPQEGVLGDPIPDFTVGLRNSITYKGFNLSFLFDFRQGGDVYNGTKGVLYTFGMHQDTEDREDLVVFDGVKGQLDAEGNWQATTTANDVQVRKGLFYQNYGFVNLTELTIEDGSWIRLRELGLSYELPSAILDKTPVSQATIRLSARNLFLITDYTGIDPETNLTGDASNVLGYDYFNNPNTRSFGAALTLTF